MATENEYGIETQKHIQRVFEYVGLAVENLENRQHTHDRSKLVEPERSGFIAMVNRAPLSTLEYNSDEYREVMEANQETINHHYKANDHHPEHFPEGIRSMSAMALIEMLCDWKAATERMKDGNMMTSMEKNKERFKIDDQLFSVLMATARELGFV